MKFWEAMKALQEGSRIRGTTWTKNKYLQMRNDDIYGFEHKNEKKVLSKKVELSLDYYYQYDEWELFTDYEEESLRWAVEYLPLTKENLKKDLNETLDFRADDLYWQMYNFDDLFDEYLKCEFGVFESILRNKEELFELIKDLDVVNYKSDENYDDSVHIISEILEIQDFVRKAHIDSCKYFLKYMKPRIDIEIEDLSIEEEIAKLVKNKIKFNFNYKDE